jgi:hypothetical protein
MLVAREGMAEQLKMLSPESWSPQVHGTLVHLANRVKSGWLLPHRYPV